MNDILQHYVNEFNIDIKKAEKRRLVPTENGTITQVKEMIGEAIIKKYHLFDWLFPENIGYKKVTETSLQKAGADFQIFFEDRDPIYIDLKSCIGPDYSMKKEDFDELEITEDLLNRKGVPIEIYQNNFFTNTSAKLTDYMLYIICDKDGIFYCSLSYEEVRNFSIKHKTEYIIDKESGTATTKRHYPFTRYTSNNGTGLYAKDPIIATKLIQ